MAVEWRKIACLNFFVENDWREENRWWSGASNELEAPVQQSESTLTAVGP